LRASSTLTVATDRGDRVDLSGHYLEAGHVRHAYALTRHSGPFLTVDRAFVLGSVKLVSRSRALASA
jgi:hypothetical protein